MMDNIPILFVRYAPGAAGNFFISIIQTSFKVSCWNNEVQSAKGTAEFNIKFKQWFSGCFQSDLPNHLKYEPHHPYQLDFFSSKHPRGNEITVEEFVSHLHDRNDQEFLNNINQKQLTVMRLNKSVIPVFGQGNTVINIIVDPPAKKWFYRTRYIKLFGQDNYGWISKENHPDFLKAKFKKVLFQNQHHFQVSKFSFLKDFVINESNIRSFFSERKLLADPSNQTCQQISINLSTIFNEEQFILTMSDVFDRLDLGPLDTDLVRWAFRHYYNNDITPIEAE